MLGKDSIFVCKFLMRFLLGLYDYLDFLYNQAGDSFEIFIKLLIFSKPKDLVYTVI